MAEENAPQFDTLDPYPSPSSERPENQEMEARAFQDWEPQDWKPQDSPSGSDPGSEDDLEAKEKEFRKMTQGPEGAGAVPDGNADGNEEDPEGPESLISQAEDPEAQES
jgi:hypothetical protein